MGRVLVWSLLALSIAAPVRSQEELPPPLAALLNSVQDAPDDAARAKPLAEIARLLKDGGEFSATSRTELLGQLLDVDWEDSQRVSWPLTWLEDAPDPACAARHLLRYTDRQLAREKEFRGKLDELAGGGSEYTLGGQNFDPALLLRREYDTIARRAFLKSLIANKEEDSTRALSKLARGMAEAQSAAPLVEELLERDSPSAIDGLISWLERGAKRYETAQARLKEAKRRRPRPAPKGQNPVKWMDGEKIIQRRLILHHQKQAQAEEDSLNAFATRIREASKQRGWPIAPRKALPLSRWPRWQKKVARSVNADR